jgi:small nuclear ribonucleoprotein (snRNP)-like protein
MSAPSKWGKEPLDFIHELQGERVLVSLVTGKAFKGKLIGADPYNLVLQQDSGLELMISKGNIVYLHGTQQ